VHLSAAEALAEVTAARDRGLPAFAETCPQYLFLSYQDYERPGFEGAKYVMSPPLRAAEKQAELWRGLLRNDLQVVSTDHCPFCFEEEKQLGRNDFSKIPNGAPGIEHRLVLTHDGGVVPGRIGRSRWVEINSTAPAKLFGLYPRKGTLAPGSDADVVVFDPAAEGVISAKTHHMRVDYSAYEGRRVRGAVELVFARGELVIEKGAFRGRAGRGRFLPRKNRFDDPGAWA
jgi:dihydropyrimidinase